MYLPLVWCIIIFTQVSQDCVSEWQTLVVEEFKFRQIFCSAIQYIEFLPQITIWHDEHNRGDDARQNFFCESCVTPNGDRGTCVEIHRCPALLKAFANPSSEIEAHLNSFKCEISNKSRSYKACCSSEKPKFKGELSNRRYCGYQHKDDYEGNPNKISIDEFPWLVVIHGVSRSTGNKMALCHGSLLNARYILTAAVCFAEPSRKFYNISNLVQIGDFHLFNKTDCVDVPNIAEQECTEVVAAEIEKIIPHPHFHYGLALYDIALIRLKQNVVFSDYIRPICLPRFEDVSLKYGDTVYTTGWGKVGPGKDPTGLKKRIPTIYTSNKDCDALLSVNLAKTFITELRFCTVEDIQNTEFSCVGDVGAPIMRSINNQWQVIGIVSSGAICGKGAPSFNTKVISFLQWIEDNIEPF